MARLRIRHDIKETDTQKRIGATTGISGTANTTRRTASTRNVNASASNFRRTRAQERVRNFVRNGGQITARRMNTTGARTQGYTSGGRRIIGRGSTIGGRRPAVMTGSMS